MHPAAIVGGRLAVLELATGRLQRLATLAVAGLVVLALVGELYRAGYKDGYRLADQVAADRTLVDRLADQREAVG